MIRRVRKGEKLGPVEVGQEVIRSAHNGHVEVVRSAMQRLGFDKLVDATSSRERDLVVRPIRHRREGRVKTHIFLCMLAYYVQWHIMQAWKPLLFADEATADQKRARDPVAPAKRSKAALDKVHSRQLVDASCGGHPRLRLAAAPPDAPADHCRHSAGLSSG